MLRESTNLRLKMGTEHEESGSTMGMGGMGEEAVLLTTRTGFEAQTIALSLQDRGIRARAVEAPAGEVLSRYPSSPRVVVAGREIVRARAVLEEIQQEASRIDWANVEMVDDEPLEGEETSGQRHTRWQVTIGVLMMPAGIVVMSIGTQWRDAKLQSLGGVLMAASLVILLAYVLTPFGAELKAKGSKDKPKA